MKILTLNAIRVLWVICALISIPLLGAEQTLSDYVTEAAEANSGIKAAFENWQSALAKISYSNTLPDPKLSYGHFIKSVETRVGPQKFRLGVAQMIPWIGKLSSRKDFATQQALLAEQELELAYIDLTLAVKEAFFNYLFLQKSIGIQKDYIDLTQILEQTAQSQVRVGGSNADVIQAQMEVNRLEYELVTLQEKEQTAIAQINAILNRPAKSPLPLPTDIETYVKTPTNSLERVANLELERVNPQLKVTSKKQSAQEARRKLVHKNRYPDATVGVDWIKTDRALMATPDRGKDPIVAFVSVNVPIWRGSYDSQEEEAQGQVARISHMYKQQQFHLQAQQERILYNFSDAKRRIELLSELLVPQAEQALSILNEAYKTGRSDFERLQNAQVALLKLQLQLERARSDLGIAAAQYQALIGES